MYIFAKPHILFNLTNTHESAQQDEYHSICDLTYPDAPFCFLWNELHTYTLLLFRKTTQLINTCIFLLFDAGMHVILFKP